MNGTSCNEARAKIRAGFIDRHGKARFYFRRVGFKPVPLPGLPWSPEFMEAYELALAGQQVEVGARRTKPGTLRALAVSYFASVGFRSMQGSTQGVYRNIIERLCDQTDREGNKLGDKRAKTLQREHIVRLMAARAERPDSANGLRKVLRASSGLHAPVSTIRPRSFAGAHAARHRGCADGPFE